MGTVAATCGIGDFLQRKRRKCLNGQTIPLGGIIGIPIGLDYSWFLIFALLA
jgi:hypothetical protein